MIPTMKERIKIGAMIRSKFRDDAVIALDLFVDNLLVFKNIPKVALTSAFLSFISTLFENEKIIIKSKK